MRRMKRLELLALAAVAVLSLGSMAAGEDLIIPGGTSGNYLLTADPWPLSTSTPPPLRPRQRRRGRRCRSIRSKATAGVESRPWRISSIRLPRAASSASRPSR